MTREEFNKILSEERDKEMTQLCKKLSNMNNASKDELVSEIMACSIGSSVNIILSALEKAGILKYED